MAYRTGLETRLRDEQEEGKRRQKRKEAGRKWMSCECCPAQDTAVGSANTKRYCGASGAVAFRPSFRSFMRLLFSPWSHKWQNLHWMPLWQPSSLNTNAHGLHRPSACVSEPIVGASAVPRLAWLSMSDSS